MFCILDFSGLLNDFALKKCAVNRYTVPQTPIFCRLRAQSNGMRQALSHSGIVIDRKYDYIDGIYLLAAADHRRIRSAPFYKL